MDRKSIIVLGASFAILMTWYFLVNRLYPPTPTPHRTNDVLQFSSTNYASNELAQPSTPPATNAPLAKPSSALSFATIETPEELLAVENENARYTFTSYGGGLKQVELKKHLEIVGSQRQSGIDLTNLVTLNQHAPWPVLAIVGSPELEGDGLFHLTRTGLLVRAEKKLTNGLSLIKEFQLGTNYLVEAVVRLENQAKQPVALPAQEWEVGTATPISPRDINTIMLETIVYNGTKADYVGDSWFANRSMGGCMPGVPRPLYLSGSNVVWAAVHNQFFTLAVIPREAAPQLMARKVDLPPPSPALVAQEPKVVLKPFGIESRLIYPAVTLPPKQSMERRFTIYAGPKEYNTLARLGSDANNNLDLIMGFGGFFGFFAKILLLSMNGLHALHMGYGIAIIVITVIIKLLFWPLTTASTRSMKRMAALQPQMKELQEKYKDDPKKMNLKLMEFMKENKVSPVSGCFPMLLQIPVFFGFYKMLQSAIELRGEHFLWAKDLSTADTIWVIPGMGFPVNPLPLIMGVTMLWQARMTPPSPGMDPMQQKIMKYMPLMFMVFLYNFSAGLTLYWTVQNLLTIAQTKLTKSGSAPTDTAPKGVGPKAAPWRARKG